MTVRPPPEPAQDSGGCGSTGKFRRRLVLQRQSGAAEEPEATEPAPKETRAATAVSVPKAVEPQAVAHRSCRHL